MKKEFEDIKDSITLILTYLGKIQHCVHMLKLSIEKNEGLIEYQRMKLMHVKTFLDKELE